ncbi:MAG: BatD family protein [Phycisphaerae bacterium]|nr:BatD family protein [Phycisphaerae bacterium]
MSSRIGLLLVWIGAICGLCAVCVARASAEVSVQAEASAQRVYVGEAFVLQVKVEGASSAEIPVLPTVPGLEARYKGGQDVSQRSTMIVNGRRIDNSYTAYIMQFEVVLSRAGVMVIPPFDVRVGGAVYTTNEVRVQAVPPQEDKDVRLKIEADNTSPYVGEPVRLRLVLGLGRAAAGAAFAVPGVEAKFDLVDESSILQQFQSDSTFELLGASVPATRGTTTFDGEEMTSYTAERVIIPREAGRVQIGPATASVDLIERKAMSIFDRDQTRRVVVPSNPLFLNVKPLPADGRPANFNGLVGRYKIGVRASPTEVNVGDPITLSIRVEGPLAVRVACPALDRQSNLVEAFRVAMEASPGSMDGRAKIFTRTLRALRADVDRIPPIELPYFDTASGRYEVARSDPIPVSVRPTRVVTAADAEGRVGEEASPSGLAVEERAGGLRFSYEGTDLLVQQGFDLNLALTSPFGVAAVAGPPVLYGAVAAVAWTRRRAAVNGPATRRKRALSEARAALSSASGDARGVAVAVSGAVRRYVGAKFDQSGDGLTSRECVELVRPHAVEASNALEELLQRCDGALYGGLPLNEAERLRDEASALLDRLEATLGGRR